MTAGFPVDPEPGEGHLPFLSGFGRAHAARDRGGDWVGQILQASAAGPGGDFGYSSATSRLAAIMIEAVVRPLHEYAEEKLFAPLGINTAGIATALLDERNRRSYDRHQWRGRWTQRSAGRVGTSQAAASRPSPSG